jgi:hypothetical protein
MGNHKKRPEFKVATSFIKLHWRFQHLANQGGVKNRKMPCVSPNN